MWQAQLRGHKLWKLVPPPECDHVCSGISFTVEPGDIGKIQLSAELSVYSVWYLCGDWATGMMIEESMFSSW
jgi:hypothetical protein